MRGRCLRCASSSVLWTGCVFFDCLQLFEDGRPHPTLIISPSHPHLISPSHPHPPPHQHEPKQHNSSTSRPSSWSSLRRATPGTRPKPPSPALLAARSVGDTRVWCIGIVRRGWMGYVCGADEGMDGQGAGMVETPVGPNRNMKGGECSISLRQFLHTYIDTENLKKKERGKAQRIAGVELLPVFCVVFCAFFFSFLSLRSAIACERVWVGRLGSCGFFVAARAFCVSYCCVALHTHTPTSHPSRLLRCGAFVFF